MLLPLLCLQCRSMLGDNQLPPLPKQIAALTQPSGAVEVTHPQDTSASAAATPKKAEPIPAATAERDAAVPLPPPVLVTVGMQHSTPSASFATQTEAATVTVNLSTQTVMAFSTTGTQQSVHCSNSGSQTEVEPVAPPQAPAALPSPRSVTVANGTQTPARPAVATVGTETEVEMVLGTPSRVAVVGAQRSDGGGLIPTATPGSRSTAFANPSLQEQVVGACYSPSPSMASEPISSRAPSSVGVHSPRAASDARTGLSSTAGGASVNGVPGVTSGMPAAPVNASQRYVVKLGEELERVMQGKVDGLV